MLSLEMRREILRSAGLDYCLLRELVHFSENVAPMLVEEKRASLAAESLRELFDQGLVFLFRSPSVHQMDEEAADETARLSAEEVHAALDAKDWAREPPGAQETVCFGLTSEGLAGLRTQEAEYDVERLEAWARREFDCLAERFAPLGSPLVRRRSMSSARTSTASTIWMRRGNEQPLAFEAIDSTHAGETTATSFAGTPN
jgi:hypothetical protein